MCVTRGRRNNVVGTVGRRVCSGVQWVEVGMGVEGGIKSW